MKNRYMIYVTLLVILLSFVLGVTYSYLASKINNSESSSTIKVESGQLFITYENNSGNIILNNIIPGDSVTKQFTLTGINNTKPNAITTNTDLKYKIGIVIDTNTFSDGALTYSLIKDSTSSTNGNIADDSNGTINQGGTQYIGKGYFSTGASNDKHIYNLTISFPDTNEDQSIDQGASFACHIIIKHDIDFPASIYLTKLDKTENGLITDNTDDNNLRFAGENAKNYLWFNNEYWRIIGVFNNFTTIDDDGNEKQESLVKIIRDEPLGSYSWDSSEEDINSGQGINEWSQAKLMTELNGDYIDTYKTSGPTYWYNGVKNQLKGKYDYSNNIKSDYIDKIATVRWNLGTSNGTAHSALVAYNFERGNLHSVNPLDGVERKDFWDGKIALMYASDYGYASTDTNCWNYRLSSNNCKNDNWLFNGKSQWTLSTNALYESAVHYFFQGGYLHTFNASNTYTVRPVLYLKSNVLITGGTGEKEIYNAYTIE